MTLAIGAYVVVLSLKKEPLAATDPAALPTLPRLPEPARLPRRASFLPASADGKQTFPPEVRDLAVLVREAPEDLARTGGVAIHDDRSGLVAWLPLAGATAAGDALRVTAKVPQHTQLAITVAPLRDTSRTSYAVRALVAPDSTEETIELRAPLQDVVVRATATDKTLASALRLRRVDDAEWTPRHAFAQSERPDAHGLLRLRLAPGEYELRPWADGVFEPVRFAVPGPREVEAAFVPK